jgi:predicted permease
LLQDIRYALRGLLRAKGFAFTVIATIGLALGSNTTMFTVFDAFVLQPIAVHDPFSLYEFRWGSKDGGGHRFTLPELENFRVNNPAFSDAFGYEVVWSSLDGQQMLGQRVTVNYFTLLGVEAALGRPLRAEDSGGAAIVLSHSAWENRFGSDPNILGKRIALLGNAYTVIGVARPEFTGTTQAQPYFWVPLTVTAQTPSRWIRVIGRLKPGLTSRQARAALVVWARQTTAERPEGEQAARIYLESAATTIPITPALIAGFAPIIAAFGLVLVIACANVANMMLARGMARQREIGVRLSLGASRFRLLRHLMTESLLLALPAGALGYAVSRMMIRFGTELLSSSMPEAFGGMAKFSAMAPDSRIFWFILAAAAGSTLVFGLVPALQATRPGLTSATRGDISARFRPSLLRNGLVISQVTVCVLLLIVSGILLRGGHRLEERDIRLATRGVLDIEVQQVSPSRVTDPLSREPWVESVATAWRTPLTGASPTIPITPNISPAGGARIRVGYNFVSPDYFGVFRVPVVRGRNFTSVEGDSEAPVVIISEATARRFWPKQEALGQSLFVEPDPRIDRGQKLPGFHTARVVGIAGDVISGMVTDGLDSAYIYFPTGPAGAQNGSLLVRVKADPEVAKRSMDTLLTNVIPGGVRMLAPMDQLLALQLFPYRMTFWISGFLGLLALILTLSGIYGVLSYLVSQRTKEIGIRMALGATKAAVVKIVLSQSMKMAGIGIAMGSVLAIGASWLCASLVEGINVFDSLAYTGGILCALIGSLAAAYFPSRRAAAVDPASTLRSE